MNAKQAKKIRKAIDKKQNEIVNSIFDCFRELGFCDRLKICYKIMTKKI